MSVSVHVTLSAIHKSSAICICAVRATHLMRKPFDCAVPGAVNSLSPATTPLYNSSALAIYNDSSPIVLSVDLGPNAHVDFTVRLSSLVFQVSPVATD